MSDVSVSEIIYTMMSLLFLLLGIVLLISILMSTINPYDQTAFANVEKLRAAMNNVCLTGNDISMSFDLPQNTPTFTSVLTVMPIWIIRTNGDPNYVLYYESFPPGDATGWEIYHGMQNRLIGPLPDGYGGGDKNSNNVLDYVKNLKDAWNSRVATADIPSKDLEGIIINNIVLGGERSDYYFGQSTQAISAGSGNNGGASGGAGGGTSFDSPPLTYGDWRQKDSNGNPQTGDNEFVLKNYKGLTSFEKTSIKYEPCGSNSLCLKTRDGVYRFPLEQCKNERIKYVEMVYDARNRKAIYVGLGATVVAVAAGACILGTGGVCAAPIAAGGEVVGGTAALGLGTATTTMPGVYTVLEGGSVAGQAIIEAGAGGTATAYTTGAAASTFGSTITSFLSGIGSTGWWAAKGFVKQLILHPFRTGTIAVGAGTGAGIATYKFGEFIAGTFLSYKVQDFNIESSCSIKQMTIKKRPCSELECSKSSSLVSYQIYTYGGDGKLTTVKNGNSDALHYTCAEKIGTEIDTPAGGPITTGNCLQVVVEEKADGFCWTPDPYKNAGTLDVLEHISGTLPGIWIPDTQALASKLNFFPIHQNTAYLSSSNINAFVMNYYSIAELENFKDRWERRLSWGWPG